MAYTHTQVPASVMAGTPGQKLTYFLDKTILHARLDMALHDALDAILSETGPDIVIVTGPTGVGKTTLAARLEREVANHFEPNRRYSPGMIPVVRLSAVTTGSQGFDWRDFYIRLLCRLDQTNPQLKLDFGGELGHLSEAPFHMAKNRLTTGGYERTIEVALQHRSAHVLIIDEANQIVVGCNPKELRRRFEVIKSLAIETGVTIILVGTYDLLEIRDQSAQLVRRSRIIHLPRYRLDDADDCTAFGSALQTFGAHMPFAQVPNLTEQFEYFYLKSAGCVGILKVWLDAVVEAALNADQDQLTIEDMEHYGMENRCLQTIIEEALVGERKLGAVSLDALKNLVLAHKAGLGQAGKSDIGRHFGKPRQKRRVGERSARRDPVGRKDAASGGV